MSNNFLFLKIVPLWDNVEKCGRARQATDDNITRRIAPACPSRDKGPDHSKFRLQDSKFRVDKFMI
jgi:hypothetical protein